MDVFFGETVQFYSLMSVDIRFYLEVKCQRVIKRGVLI